MSDHPILFTDPKITRQEGYVECGIDVYETRTSKPYEHSPCWSLTATYGHHMRKMTKVQDPDVQGVSDSISAVVAGERRSLARVKAESLVMFANVPGEGHFPAGFGYNRCVKQGSRRVTVM
jgi:hypothetical protein